MGPILLPFIAIGYILLALVTGGLFAALAYIIYRVRGASNAKCYSEKAFLVPFILLAYFLVALIVNIFVCIYIRQVDTPLSTDYWSISISKNYELGAIDNPAHWSVYPKGGGEALFSNISSVNMNSLVAYGKTNESSHYIFNRKDETIKEIKDLDALNNELKKFGVLTYSDESVGKYYSKNREFGDAITSIITFIFPLIYVFNFFRMCLYKNA